MGGRPTFPSFMCGFAVHRFSFESNSLVVNMVPAGALVAREYWRVTLSSLAWNWWWTGSCDHQICSPHRHRFMWKELTIPWRSGAVFIRDTAGTLKYSFLMETVGCGSAFFALGHLPRPGLEGRRVVGELSLSTGFRFSAIVGATYTWRRSCFFVPPQTCRDLGRKLFSSSMPTLSVPRACLLWSGKMWLVQTFVPRQVFVSNGLQRIPFAGCAQRDPSLGWPEHPC